MTVCKTCIWKQLLFGCHGTSKHPVGTSVNLYYILDIAKFRRWPYYVSQGKCQFLPPANEFCEGYVFTPVCQSFCPLFTVKSPPWEQTSPGSRHLLHSACWEIRATSGRYASYWNAYLLSHETYTSPLMQFILAHKHLY